MNNIVVKYFDPLTIFDNISLEIQKYFPIKNIHYKRFAEDNVSTIKELDIKITNDDKIDEPDIFFSFIVITCTNIDEYRNKIRPLITQWLSNNSASNHINYELGIVFIQTTIEDISDNKMFNRLNLIEKIEKDFQEIKHENIFLFPIIYKSLQDKNNFYSRFIIRLQKQIINSLNSKLKYLECLEDDLYRTSKTLDLYLRFGIVEFSQFYLERLETDYINNIDFLSNLLPGNLVIINLNKFNVFNDNILSSNGDLSYSGILQFRLISLLKLLSLKHQPLLNHDISSLHKTIIDDYLLKLEKVFANDINLDKFMYLMIENVFMKLPLLLSNLSKKTIVNELNKKEWNLFLGRLSKIKRQAWINMVDSYGILPFEINENPLKNGREHVINIIDNLADTEESILNEYINLTQNVISYWKELKPVTIDLLSADIGIIFNKFGQHEKTIAILHSTFEYYYNVMKWEDLSIQLLDVYIDSLEKLCQEDSLQKVIIDDELVPIVTVLANCYLNFTCLMKNDSNGKSFRSLNRKLETWDKFLELNANTDLTYPLKRLINLNMELIPKLGYDLKQKCHYYYINITWDWLIDAQIILNLDLVKLKMRNLVSDNIIIFDALNAKLSDTNTLTLRCYEIEFGECELISIELFLRNNNTIFMKEFDERLKMNIIPLHSKDKFEVLIQEPFKHEDDKILLDVRYENYHKDKEEKNNIDLKFEVLEPNYLIFKDSGSSEINFMGNSMPSVLEFEINDKNFEFVPNINIIIKTNISVNNTFNEQRILFCQFTNPLSISASLIPKLNTTYLDVSVDCVYEPFNILSSSLIEQTSEVDKENIKSKTNLSVDINNIVLPNNPLSSYKNFFILSDNKERKLIYEIQYKTLRSAIQGYLTKSFLNEYSEFFLYKTVWEQYILPKFQFHTSQFIHFKTIKLKVYDEADFSEYLQKIVISGDKLNAKFIENLMIVYRKLFDGIQLKENEHIWDSGKLQTFNKEIDFGCSNKENNLFTITLKNFSNETNLKMGNSYKYELLINKKQKRINNDDNNNNKKKEQYECIVLDNSEISDWLVGGFNKFCLDNNAETETFEISLIPIKRGYLKYPKIKIVRCDDIDNDTRNNTHLTDFININENIIII